MNAPKILALYPILKVLIKLTKILPYPNIRAVIAKINNTIPKKIPRANPTAIGVLICAFIWDLIKDKRPCMYPL